MTTQTEERTERADRWLRVRTDRMLGIEPDWWLRMACGQVAEVSESPAALGVIADIEEDRRGQKQS
jgi:hypothetical protein